MKDQSKAIAEAFAEDDVLAADFKSEKRAAVDAERPKDLDTFLDGWGTWGGEGIKESIAKLYLHSGCRKITTYSIEMWGIIILQYFITKFRFKL